ncbi:structural maintenance of chromosomes flexible hinge domain-containing protein 1 [Odontesthes bonariensis]|uniref:structural maintenance of chromosomes flexible hinge domain-containing protein 1 n=1 Tax=Odontesthes bonariensis TaxID=219752 RepID=UPI003F58A35F
MHHPSAVVSLQRGRSKKEICVYDCRFENREAAKKTLDICGLDFNGFLKHLSEIFSISLHQTFVLVTTDRTVIDYDTFEKLQSSTTLYMLQHEGQALPAATKEDILFVPHYDTLIQCGTFEYYADGKESLPYALAELVDNSLSATATNKGGRQIEIRTLLDKTVGKPAIVVLDNGRGMTSKQLNNWAVYRLSKFLRKNDTFESQREGYVRPGYVPRSLNSDISYFGVGGKNAAFFIGDSVKMITKPATSPDVHELILSKEEFERKEENNEDVYKGTILNRKPCDSSHVALDEGFLRSIIAEESGKESFTAVVITGVKPDHITYLLNHFDKLATELAHIYHYYIHGVNGNDMRRASPGSDNFQKIDFLLTLREKPPKFPHAIHLREVVNDMQTLYINAAVDTFEFRASVGPDGGTVEGIIRYHPFLYDRETYPKDPSAAQASVGDDDDCENEPAAQNQARGKRDIFECFWNGRLIPYTTVSEFDWCSRRIKEPLPAECFSRFSGVLFTDDKFQVSTSKLQFMELELKLRNKDTIFTPIGNVQKHSKRGDIQKKFLEWLQNCHNKHDKQVKFRGYKETITRLELSKKMQHPWNTFSSIEWDGKIYKEGQLVKSHRTVPIYHGTVVRFLLYGYDVCCKGDVFATGGQVEIKREPEALYGTTKIMPISKIDRAATDEAIKSYIENELDKWLPEKLNVDWPDGNSWPQDDVCPAGTPLGPLRVDILNRKGDPMSRINTWGTGMGMKMNVGLKVVAHGPKKDCVVVSCVAPYVSNSRYSGYWFKKIESLAVLGKYTLTLFTLVNEGKTTLHGQQLPSYVLKFTIKEGKADSFTLGAVSPSVRVGVPFNIPLHMKDHYGNPTAPPPQLQPDLKCSGLELSFETFNSSGKGWLIKGVKAKGKVQNYQQSESYDLCVTLPGLTQDNQTFMISLLPGNPHSLHVKSEVAVENGNPAIFEVEIHDEAGNITANPKQSVFCQIQGLPVATADCSSTGAGKLETKPIKLKIVNGEPQTLKVKFDMPNQKHIRPYLAKLKVLPSSQVSMMKLYSEDDNRLVLENNEKIEWQAGGVVQNLFYKLFDESGREVPLTAEIASMIKVNWTGVVDRTELAHGSLPDVQVPAQVQEERFCQVSYQHQSVSFSFTIVPCPDEPKQLKATLPQSTLKLGETLSGHIILELVDQFDNVTQKLTPACVDHITLKAEGLDKSAIQYTWQPSSRSVEVTGLRFHSGSPGSREMCFHYGRYEGWVNIKVSPGDPALLKLIGEPEQTLQVLNGRGIPTPFSVQLYDEFGNPSPDKRVVAEIRSSSPSLQVMTDVISQPVDAEGKASFKVNCVSGAKGHYQLHFKSSFNNKPIPGPSVNLTVISDPTKPVCLSVSYDTTAKCLAGGPFPVFSVVVVSDEGSPITTFQPTAVTMHVRTEDSSTSPQTFPELKCSKPMENDKRDRFYFRDKKVPEQVGKYVIHFSLNIDETNVMRSKQIHINVEANQPVKLGPDSQPPAPVVSHSMDISRRTLVENMSLQIMDAFGNPAGQDLNGKVIVSITCSDARKALPLFEGQTNSIQMSLDNGRSHIFRLAIVENSPGENGSKYMLLFKPEVSTGPSPLLPFELPFHFYNGAENQQKVSELIKKKDELIRTLSTIEEHNISYSALRDLFMKQVMATKQKEASLRDELNKRTMKIEKPLSIPDIDKLLQEKKAECEGFERMTRRVCSIRNNFSGPDVLGTVAHLAVVEDDEAARVISWHVRGDMDCVITRTTEAAQRIYKDTRGNQQVMPLDGIIVQQGDRPLPHIRNGRSLFDAPGNPVRARQLLIYPDEKEKCDIVFKNLLGDTILLDDLDSATNYRKAVVEKRIPCPTILTRQGDMVSAKGKFGGRQNKAPPIDRLQVFGAPLPQQYYTLKKDLELLSQYHKAMTNEEKAVKDHDDHINKWKSPEMQQNRQRKEAIQKQLEEIDRQLASATVRSGKRGPESAGEPSGISTKRPRPT